MSFGSTLAKATDFSVTATAGDARACRLTVNGMTMETPSLFPVINFYGGGRKGSLFGGSTHRTVKELINGDDRVDGVDCSSFFEGAMMSVGSLTDYGIRRDLLDEYLADPVKSRPEFEGFDGMLFTDSGGYKNLTQGGLDGSDFEIELNQQTVFEMQKALGGEILVNLDLPIQPDDSFDERVQKARQTAENAIEFLRVSKDYPAARFLTVQGYNYSMIDTFFDELQAVFGNMEISKYFDGIALGGLVPKKDNKGVLIDAVQGCRQVMNERGLSGLPLHVLGISRSSIPILAAVGADTFDSSSYIQAAINGKYYRSLFDTVRVDEVDLSKCDCPVCSSEELRSRMRGNAEYRKDKMGPVAVHNQYVQMQELEKIRNCIRDGGKAGLVEYIDNTVGRNRSTRRFAHRVVNESLGGYF
ncbi:tRNA-guanine transglycosylase [Haloarchaeobius sp. DFWS5]|uniref:tRNA-guanine transglycosylase n=1 Tax=Haloarchaeobius sp. DFWS5 TaxID=3446114 RepID=UPI003EB99F67